MREWTMPDIVEQCCYHDRLVAPVGQFVLVIGVAFQCIQLILGTFKCSVIESNVSLDWIPSSRRYTPNAVIIACMIGRRIHGHRKQAQLLYISETLKLWMTYYLLNVLGYGNYTVHFILYEHLKAIMGNY